ncbi:MAG: prepilin peptidase [Candidatus Fermentithermobacillus carboniphilus]|uniref:Prepilin peptidase n=1 Tax=Candidatus Fermentithermobacillus carboniphilus TaxID=3085328 RepID=A0AAT9LCW7_9FIRM|nr:MAG: prepilin peptidase [Candidatus Fermentithermobacillus carboniphilus]
MPLQNDFFLALMGLCFGSFLAALASRLPAGVPVTGRSHCPNCQAQLGFTELIPVLSFVLLRGRCKHCGARISPAYPTLELATAVIVPAFLHRYGMGAEGALNLIIAFHFVVLAGSDWLYGILPDRILASLSCFTLLLKLLSGHKAFWSGLAGGLLGFSFLYAVILLRPDAIGAGDVKMAGVVGLYMGASRVFPALGLSFVLAAAYALPLLALGKKKPHDVLPLGVFLSAGSLIVSLAQLPQLSAILLDLGG